MTTNRIQLGLCCLNTVLRDPEKLPGQKKKPDPIFMSRSMIQKTMEEPNGIDIAKQRSFQNIKDIKTMIDWNLENHINVQQCWLQFWILGCAAVDCQGSAQLG